MIAVFALGIVAVLLVPFTFDVILSHRTYRDVISRDPAATNNVEPRGMQGLARATMAFAVIAVVGFALIYILVERPFTANKTVVGNILVALTTTLARTATERQQRPWRSGRAAIERRQRPWRSRRVTTGRRRRPRLLARSYRVGKGKKETT